MLNKRRPRGGRMQNYYPTPVRYGLSAGDSEDDDFAPRLAGFAFIVAGVLILVRPILASARFGTAILFPILGGPTLSIGGPSAWVIVTLGLTSLLVGVGIVGGGRLWRVAGAVMAVLMFAGSWPIGTLAAAAIVWALWPTRKGVAEPLAG